MTVYIEAPDPVCMKAISISRYQPSRSWLRYTCRRWTSVDIYGSLDLATPPVVLSVRGHVLHLVRFDLSLNRTVPKCYITCNKHGSYIVYSMVCRLYVLDWRKWSVPHCWSGPKRASHQQPEDVVTDSDAQASKTKRSNDPVAPPKLESPLGPWVKWPPRWRCIGPMCWQQWIVLCAYVCKYIFKSGTVENNYLHFEIVLWFLLTLYWRRGSYGNEKIQPWKIFKVLDLWSDIHRSIYTTTFLLICWQLYCGAGEKREEGSCGSRKQLKYDWHFSFSQLCLKTLAKVCTFNRNWVVSRPNNLCHTR